jgi:hypothetical protein|tara:strand:+ start:194350 stop:194475 length:126 start_codon:yes stop_codon:yes gene_type:complete
MYRKLDLLKEGGLRKIAFIKFFAKNKENDGIIIPLQSKLKP